MRDANVSQYFRRTNPSSSGRRVDTMLNAHTYINIADAICVGIYDAQQLSTNISSLVPRICACVLYEWFRFVIVAHANVFWDAYVYV